MLKKVLIFLVIISSCKVEMNLSDNKHKLVSFDLIYKRKSLMKNDTSTYNYRVISSCINDSYAIESKNRYVYYVNDSLFIFYKKTNQYTVKKKNKYISFIRPICNPYKELFRDSTLIIKRKDTIIVKNYNNKKSFEFAYLIRNERIVNIQKKTMFYGYEQYEQFLFRNIKDTLIDINTDLIEKKREFSKYKSVKRDIDNKNLKIIFSGHFLNGNSFRTMDFAKKKVLYFFWHRKCVPCILSMSKLNNLFEKYKNDIVFIGINAVDNEHEISKVLKENKVHFSNVLTNEIKNKIYSYPYFIVLENNKEIFSSSGYSDKQFVKIDSVLKTLLK